MQIQSSLQPSTVQANSQESKLREAAMDFEALLIAQMLNSFREESTDGGLGGDPSSCSTSMLQFADQQLARVMSRAGGLGLHELIVQGLLRKETSAAET